MSSFNPKDFWASAKRLTRHDYKKYCFCYSADANIAELCASKLNINTKNYSCGNFSQLINAKVSISTLSELSVTPDVSRAFKSSDHMRHAISVIAAPLVALFTFILRHSYMPSSLRDCTVLSLPKGLKVASRNCGIAIASTLSKVDESVILLKYSTSSDLQFGFKPGLFTTLCTGVLKTTISRYINRNSFVYGCFLDVWLFPGCLKGF